MDSKRPKYAMVEIIANLNEPQGPVRILRVRLFSIAAH